MSKFDDEVADLINKYSIQEILRNIAGHLEHAANAVKYDVRLSGQAAIDQRLHFQETARELRRAARNIDM